MSDVGIFIFGMATSLAIAGVAIMFWKDFGEKK